MENEDKIIELGTSLGNYLLNDPYDIGLHGVRMLVGDSREKLDMMADAIREEFVKQYMEKLVISRG